MRVCIHSLLFISLYIKQKFVAIKCTDDPKHFETHSSTNFDLTCSQVIFRSYTSFLLDVHLIKAYSDCGLIVLPKKLGLNFLLNHVKVWINDSNAINHRSSLPSFLYTMFDIYTLFNNSLV